MGQNFGAGKIDRCKRTLALCLAEGIAIGCTRLMMVMVSHSFSLLYEIMAGYLRGFGISLTPAVLTMFGVCGIRIAWIRLVFPQYRTFRSIMAAYPVSLSATACLLFLAVLSCRPARKYAPQFQT